MPLLPAVKHKEKKKTILCICVFLIHDRTLVAQFLGYRFVYPPLYFPVNLFPSVLLAQPSHSKNERQNVTSHYSNNKIEN